MSSSIDEHSDDSKIPHAPKTTIEPIYVMTIELDQGKAEHIKVFADSIAEEVSYDFCRKNNLDYQSLTYLKKQIEDLVNEHQLKVANSKKGMMIPKPNQSPAQSEAEVQTITQFVQEQQIEHHIQKQSSQSHMQTQTEPIGNDNSNKNVNTPVKGTLFSCESFFVTLQERNSRKVTKKPQGQKLIQHIKDLKHRNDSMKSIRNNTKAYTFTTPMHTDHQNKTNRPRLNNNNSNQIPRPNKKCSNDRIEANQSLLHLNCWDGEQGSYISCNNHSRISNKGTSPMNTQSHKNIGEILYEKGNKLLEKKREEMEAMRAELIIKSNEEHTFKPLINSSSSSSKKHNKQYLNNNNSSIINEDNHSNSNNTNQEEKNKSQFSNNKKTNSNGNSFISPIIPKTQSSSYHRSEKGHGHSSLSQKKSLGKSAKFYEEFSYQPHLTDYHLTNQTRLPFSSRQKHFQKKYEANESKLRDQYLQNIDDKTGQPFFKPILISKQHKRAYTPAKENIFKDLYSYATFYKVNQSKRKDLIEKEFKRMIKPKLADNTEEIFQKKKENIFLRIFQLFDSDEDGLISIYTIDSNKLQENIMKIISPVIEDLKEYQGSINKEEFVEECNKLFEKLSYRDRKELLEMNKRQKDTGENYSFKPTINKTGKRRSVQHNDYTLYHNYYTTGNYQRDNGNECH